MTGEERPAAATPKTPPSMTTARTTSHDQTLRNQQPAMITVSSSALSDVIIPPKVYRFNCKGAFSLRHDKLGSAGVCRGIQSRLERVEAMIPPSALSTPTSNVPFQERQKDIHGLFHDLKTQDKENLNQNRNQNLADPDEDMIQRYNDWSTHSLVYGELELQALTRRSTKKQQQQQQDEPCLKKEKEMLTRLHSFGSTNVHVLVASRAFGDADNTTVETVLGVQADCRQGVVFSNKATSQERERGTLAAALCALPWFSYGMRLFYEPDEEEEELRRKLQQRRAEQQKRYQEAKRIHNNEDDETLLDTMTFQDMMVQFSRASFKVLVHMQKNAVIVFHTVQDDFPNRVVHSGHRITGEFEKTLDRTGRLMGSVVRLWFGNHDDNQPKNNNQHRRSRRRRGDYDDDY